MNILYLGDIYGEPGIKIVEKLLPGLRKQYSVDVVIAQAENVTEGRGIDKSDYNKLKKIGVDFFTGGNWILSNKEIYDHLNDPAQPIIRPANYPVGTEGLGFKYLNTPKGKILVINLLGQIVGKDAKNPMNNPLKTVDHILETEDTSDCDAILVDFHGDYSSEKLVIGLYLDGRVSAVVGDHWHIATADAAILPKGTAHISDVGMCGTIYSSLGVKTNVIVKRWRDHATLKNEIEEDGELQLNAVLIDTVDKKSSKSIVQIRELLAQY